MSIRLKITFFISLVLIVSLTACGDSTAPAPATTSSITTAAATTSSLTTAPVTTQSSPTTVAPTIASTTTGATTAPNTTSAATTTSSTTTTASSATTAASIGVSQSNLERGLALFRSQGCANCHGGDKATGKIGPALNNLSFGEDGLLRQVRSGAAPMPAYPADKLPDSDVQLIYDYLISLKGK